MIDYLPVFITGIIMALYGEYRVHQTRKRWAQFTRNAVKMLNTAYRAGNKPRMTELVFDGFVIIDPDEEGRTVN